MLSDQFCDEIDFHLHLNDRGGVTGIELDQIVWEWKLDRMGWKWWING